jgi:hypothetical protein
MLAVRGKATRAKVQQAVRNAETAAAKVQPALDQVEAARNTLRGLMADRDKILITISQGAKQVALDATGDKQESERVQAAIRAIPILERVVGEAKAIVAAIALPGYTAGSGFGAALTTNIDELISHVAALKGTKADMEERAAYWDARVKSAHNLVKNIK